MSLKSHALKTSKQAEYSSPVGTSLKQKKHVLSLFFFAAWHCLWDYTKSYCYYYRYFISFCHIICVKHLLDFSWRVAQQKNITSLHQQQREQDLLVHLISGTLEIGLCGTWMLTFSVSLSANVQTAADSSEKHLKTWKWCLRALPCAVHTTAVWCFRNSLRGSQTLH